MTASSSLAPTVERLAAESAITRLVHEYAHGADKRDLDRFLAVWHPDAVWIAGEPMRGIAAIGGAIQEQWSLIPEYHHYTANLVIAVDGDTARAESDVLVTVRFDSGWTRSGGTYRDRFERRDGTWKFVERDATEGYTMDALPDGFEP